MDASVPEGQLNCGAFKKTYLLIKINDLHPVPQVIHLSGWMNHFYIVWKNLLDLRLVLPNLLFDN
jgi:hypothetical protein